MDEKLTSHFLDLFHDALLKSFWRRNALLNFLRRNGISEAALASWQEDTKRTFLSRLIPKLETHPKGGRIIKGMAESLAEQTKFPDLEGWEDEAQKVQTAKSAVAALRAYMTNAQHDAETQKLREAARMAYGQQIERAIASRQSLESLATILTQLSQRIGSQEAGYQFQDWFYDLVSFFEVIHRRPYVSNGRQIDGSLTIDGTTYLTELKFTRGQASAPDVDTFLAKINDKADNTMGIMVSMSGYSSTAIEQASGRKTPMILMDSSHIYLVLSGSWTLPEVACRLRRHASQTGQAFLPAKDFGG